MNQNNITIIVVGPNGSGKSLVLKRIIGTLQSEMIPTKYFPYSLARAELPEKLTHWVEIDLESMKENPLTQKPNT